MPIDLYSSSKAASRWAFGSPFLNKILGSSLFVSGIVAFLMILLIMVMYPAKPGTSFSIVVKMFIYMFFGSLLVIFLHDGVVRYLTEEERNEKQADAFMQNITQTGRTSDPSYAAMYKPITPQINTPQTASQSTSQTVAQTTGAAEPDEPERQEPPSSPLPSTFVVSDRPAVSGGAPAKWKPRPAAMNPYR